MFPEPPEKSSVKISSLMKSNNSSGGLPIPQRMSINDVLKKYIKEQKSKIRCRTCPAPLYIGKIFQKGLVP